MRSPLIVTGQAVGPWFHEASFSLRLLDAHERSLADSYAQAEGEWMTESFVPFRGELQFVAPSEGAGTLVFEKANASGLPEHADAFCIPVQFAR